MSTSSKRFLSWRDFLITPLVELVLLSSSFLLVYFLWRTFALDFFACVVVFFLSVNVLTLLFLFLLRMLFPIRRGAYSVATRPGPFYVWRLHTFLCTTNLSVLYLSWSLPPILRSLVYRFLGTKMKGGLSSIAGRLLDPYLITVEDSVTIGDDSLLIPYSYLVGSSDIVLLDHIVLKKGAVIGPRCTLMPGVTVGENSMVKAMSLVPMNTKIPPNEIWGGIPAQKMADVDKPLSEAA